MWAALLPLLDNGTTAIDFDLIYRYDIDEESPEWDRRTWHWLRNRIVRLASITEEVRTVSADKKTITTTHVPTTPTGRTIANVRGRPTHSTARGGRSRSRQ